jgi:hypothetical protein
MLRYTDGIKSIVASVFAGVVDLIKQAISECGENPEDYIISTYPFEIERADKKPIDPEILEYIEQKLKA